MAGVTTPVTSPNAYANVDDLTLYWKAPDDDARAEYILKMVSNRLRLVASDSSVDIDTQVNDNEIYFLNVQAVVMEAAKRALQASLDQQPTETYGMTAGPYSENFKYSNPSGDIFFRKSELALLGLSGNQRMSNVSTTSNDIYSAYESS